MNQINPLSFKEAINSANNIIKNQKSNNSTWLSKKIYLGYTNEAGWKIHELGFFDRLLRKLNLAYRDTHFRNVCEKLEKLTPEEATLISSSGLIEKMPKLKQKLSEICQKKIQDISISKQIQKTASPEKPPPQQSKPQQLILAPSPDTSNAPLSTLSSTRENSVIENAITPQNIEEEFEQYEPPHATTPLFLKNYQSSRCYIDSVLEIMLSQDLIREKIFQKYITLNQDLIKESTHGKSKNKDIILKKIEILEKLLDLMIVVDKVKGQGQGNQSPIGKNSPGEKIRETIFTSRLNSDLSNPKNIYKQQDAAAILLLINDLLDNTFNTVEVDTAIGADIVSTRPIATESKLELRLEEGSQNNLNALINKAFTPHVVDNLEDYKTFELEDGSLSQLPYTTQTELKSLPDSMTLHLARYKYNIGEGAAKLSEPVALPKDGIVDLTPYYSGKEPGPHKYEITGYVVHQGNNLAYGHYVANVKIGDKYYECDDMSTTFHKEIKAKEFYGNPNAYLVMLKKIPPTVPVA